MVAPMTRSPGCFSTGIGSPVTIDSSTALEPSSTTPSTGTFSPGRTRSVADLHLLERHVLLVAVLRMRRAVWRQPEQLLDGALVWLRARSSSTWPSRISVTMTAAPRSRHRPRRDHRGTPAERAAEAASRRGCSRRPRYAEADQREHVEAAVDDRLPAADEERPAAPEARPVWREAISDQLRNEAAIAPMTERDAQGALTQKRRVMSISSGFGPSSSVTVRGSSAMPQIGQEPGRPARSPGASDRSTLHPRGGRRTCVVFRGIALGIGLEFSQLGAQK